MRGTRKRDGRSRVLRCSPAGFDVGSDRGERVGWFSGSVVHFINTKSFAGCGACGYVSEGEHFSAFRACSGGGGSGAGQRSRSSTYPQTFLVDFPRRTVTKALMLALIIVQSNEITPIRSRSLRSSTRGIRGSDGLFMSMR